MVVGGIGSQVPCIDLAAESGRTANRQLLGQLVPRQQRELRQRDVSKSPPDVLSRARLEHLRVEENETAIHAPVLGEVAGNAELDAADAILALACVPRI